MSNPWRNANVMYWCNNAPNARAECSHLLAVQYVVLPCGSATDKNPWTVDTSWQQSQVERTVVVCAKLVISYIQGCRDQSLTSVSDHHRPNESRLWCLAHLQLSDPFVPWKPDSPHEALSFNSVYTSTIWWTVWHRNHNITDHFNSDLPSNCIFFL